MRTSKIERITNETKVNLVLNLDGVGRGKIETNIPFLSPTTYSISLNIITGLILANDSNNTIGCPSVYEGKINIL